MKPVIIHLAQAQVTGMPATTAMTALVNIQTAQLLAERTEEALEHGHTDALKLAKELVEVSQILYGPWHLDVGIAQFYLAMALEEAGKVTEAISVRRKARRILLGHRICLN